MQSEMTLHTKSLPIVAVFDISPSMGETHSGNGMAPIEELGEALPFLLSELQEIDDYLVELAVVVFSDHPKVLLPFTDVNQVSFPQLSVEGFGTNLGGAVGMALDMAESYKASVTSNGIQCMRPWMILMTDGKPNRDTSTGYKTELVQAVQDRQLHLVPVSVGADAAFVTLDALSPLMTPLRLIGGHDQTVSWKECFKFIGTSIASGSTPEDKVLSLGPRTADLTGELS